MPFAAELRDSLRVRERQVPSELANGDSLEVVLSRHLVAVEERAEGDLLTSILLLDPDGRRLWHGAAPNLPRSYCQQIDGSQIGPRVGSCGTAAYLGCPVYVIDIASDPLWADYRHLALPHGLRACWSTPIRSEEGAVIGTFAIYRRHVGGPTADEIEIIQMITDHVAQAIMCARYTQDKQCGAAQLRSKPLKIVSNEDFAGADPDRVRALLQSAERLATHADELDRVAGTSTSEVAAEAMKAVAADCRRLISVIRHHIEPDNHLQTK